MTIPLVILAILSFAGGFIELPAPVREGGNKLSQFLSPVIPLHEGSEVSHTTEWGLMGLSTALVIVAALFAYARYRKYAATEEKGFGKLLENKWYVDELYDSVIVKPLNRLGDFFNKVFESQVVDWMVNGVGKAVNYGSRQLRLLQRGQVGVY